MSFDSYLIQYESLDRLTDILVDVVSVLSFSDLCSSDTGGVIVFQYREMVSYLRQPLEVRGTGMPVLEDVVSLWFSYPLLDRCRVCTVMQIVFCGIPTGPNKMDFLDVGCTALSGSMMLSSLHVVRNWLSSGTVG